MNKFICLLLLNSFDILKLIGTVLFLLRYFNKRSISVLEYFNIHIYIIKLNTFTYTINKIFYSIQESHQCLTMLTN